MHPDTLSVILRSASFVALFQAAGMALFLGLFGRLLEASKEPISTIARASAFAAAILLLAQYALEAARMADDMAGILDPSLQMMAMHSASSTVLIVRLSALALIVIGVGRGGDIANIASVIGVALVASSFSLTGHTVANPMRWAMAPLLISHVMIVTFWFGALLPLYLVSTRESSAIAGRVTAAFSRLAGWLVPAIFAAGFLLGAFLVRHLAEFRLPYGLSLLGKAGGFAVLMGFAAFNKWRLGPAMASGNRQAVRVFRCSLVLEYVLITAVLTVTAAMTTFYSPDSKD